MTNHSPESAPLDDYAGQSNPSIFSENLPENATNIDIVDSIIAHQMMTLSMGDREKVYMDVHGVRKGPSETKEAIQEGLDSMQREIDKLQDKRAYELAWSKDSKYVENQSFRLAFLRADSFDARKAALRFVRHFQVKLDLFGEDKLVLDIVQDDLDPEAMEDVYCGREQLLDARDPAGRSIVLAVVSGRVSERAVLQKGFYNAMTFIGDPERQKNGFVIIVYGLGNQPVEASLPTPWKATKISQVLPVRIEAMHFCQDSVLRQVLFAIVKTALGPFTNMRTKTHYGTHSEVMSSLTGFGIAPGTIPVVEGCKITNLQAHRERLMKMRSVERRHRPRRQKVAVPFKVDVLFGKGTPFQTHPGNIQLRALVSERYKMYEKAGKGIKKEISLQVVQTIQLNGGLFLRPDGDSWVCVEDETARQKVSALFRTLRCKTGDK